MQTKHLFLLPALAFLACTGLHAQVTIGGLTEPQKGARFIRGLRIAASLCPQ